MQNQKIQTFDVVRKPGQVCAINGDTFEVTLQGGRLEVHKVRVEGGQKVTGAEFARASGLEVGMPIIF